ncbi:MAG TPA: hypothetical protein VJN88_13735 [Ktedonobacterales bacterium]|nr:hypothetical protein [Ktedonobacterales bacterium]
METEKCLRCGTPYAPDATVCLTCGAPIGETRSSTQPVRAVKVPRDEPETPTSESAPAPEADPSRVRTLASASAAVATRPAQPSAPQRRGPGRGLFVAVFLLVLALAAGAVYAAHIITAAPPVTHQSVYHDPQHRFSFTRPTLWQVTTTTDGALLTDSGGVSTAQISVSAPPAGQDAATEADSLAKSLGLSADTPQSIAGEEWQQRSGQVTGTDGAVHQVALLVTLHAGQLYVIKFSSPTASYSGINNLVYQPLLASFQFA